jgi:hypothetical protein
VVTKRNKSVSWASGMRILIAVIDATKCDTIKLRDELYVRTALNTSRTIYREHSSVNFLKWSPVISPTEEGI